MRLEHLQQQLRDEVVAVSAAPTEDAGKIVPGAQGQDSHRRFGFDLRHRFHRLQYPRHGAVSPHTRIRTLGRWQNCRSATFGSVLCRSTTCSGFRFCRSCVVRYPPNCPPLREFTNTSNGTASSGRSEGSMEVMPVYSPLRFLRLIFAPPSWSSASGGSHGSLGDALGRKDQSRVLGLLQGVVPTPLRAPGASGAGSTGDEFEGSAHRETSLLNRTRRGAPRRGW